MNLVYFYERLIGMQTNWRLAFDGLYSWSLAAINYLPPDLCFNRLIDQPKYIQNRKRMKRISTPDKKRKESINNWFLQDIT